MTVRAVLPQRRQRKWLVGWLLLAIGLACLALVWFARRPAARLPRWGQILAAINAEDWEQAHQLLTAWLERSPNDPAVLLQMAFVQDRRGDMQGCLDSLRRVPNSAPQKLEARFREGWVLQKALYGAQSERAWLEYLSQSVGHPNQEASRFNAADALVVLYKMESRFREARDLLWTLYEASNNEAAKHRAATMATKLEFHRMAPDVVIPTLQKFIERDPQDYHAKRGLGAMLIMRGDAEQGCAILQACVVEQPDDLDAWDLWIDGLLRRGDIPAAEHAVRQLPEAADRSAPIWAHRGYIWIAQGDVARAIEAYDRALAIEPFRREWRYVISRLLRDAGQPELAEEHAQKARDRLERYAEFQRLFGPVAEDAPVQSVAQMRQLADWCEHLGLQRESLAWFELILGRDPHDATAQAGRARLNELVRNRPTADDNPSAGKATARAATANRSQPAPTALPPTTGRLSHVTKGNGRDREPMEPAAGRSEPRGPRSALRFAEVARESGIEFEYFSGADGRFLPIEANGGGLGMFDYDGDGNQDLYFVSGNLSGTSDVDPNHISRVFRNGGAGKFHDVSEPSGLGYAAYGFACAAGDYDNDGFTDLYLACYGRNVLHHNNGDGTFSNASAASGTDCDRFSSSCAFGDLDRDGNLDLYVATYVEFDPVRFRPCENQESRQLDYCPPHHFVAQHDVLFRNEGDGSFRDISMTGGILEANGKGLGVVIANLDDDDWPDVFVANDGENNFLFQNRSASAPGEIRVQDVALSQGAAVNGNGQAQACMGIGCGDYDRDGRLDLIVTNFFMEACTLYHNRGPQGFMDVTAIAGLTVPTTHTMGWGTQLVDFDNDGWLDLFITNGHVVQTVPVYSMPPQIFRNVQGRFQEVSEQAGGYFQERWVGRGAAFGDYDNDGRPDIAVSHLHRPIALLHNETVSHNRALRLELVGRRSNRDAINASVSLTATGNETDDQTLPLVREITGGGSYLSSNDRRMLIGVGPAQQVSIQVRWPSGHVDRWSNLPVDRAWYLIEGSPPQERERLGPSLSLDK